MAMFGGRITEGVRGHGTATSIWQDYLIVRAPAAGKPPVETKAEPVAMACFKIRPEGYERRWTLPVERGWWKEHPPAIADGYLYARLIGPAVLCIEVATGKVVASADCRLGTAGATMVYVDGRLFVRGADGVYCYDLRRPR